MLEQLREMELRGLPYMQSDELVLSWAEASRLLAAHDRETASEALDVAVDFVRRCAERLRDEPGADLVEVGVEAIAERLAAHASQLRKADDE